MSTLLNSLSGLYQVVKESILHPFVSSYLVPTPNGYIALRPGVNLRGVDLREVDLSEVDLSGIDLSGAILNSKAAISNADE